MDLYGVVVVFDGELWWYLEECVWVVLEFWDYVKLDVKWVSLCNFVEYLLCVWVELKLVLKW